MFHEIVVPVDGSEFGELALPKALGIACQSGGEVRIVTVITPLASAFGSDEDQMLEEERLKVSRIQARDYMEDLQKRVILSGCGADGFEGLDEIDRVGGVTLVQDQHTALCNGMINAAMSRVNVGHVEHDSRIAAVLNDLMGNH